MKKHGVYHYQVNTFKYILFYELPNLREFYITQDSFHNVNSNLEICDYPKLQTIYIGARSFQNVNNLKICNNNNLETINFGGFGGMDDSSFMYTDSVVFESIKYIIQ